MRIDIDGDVSRICDQMQYNEVLRTREQEERRQSEEVAVFDEDGLTYREYCERRAAAEDMFIEPDIPVDEMTFRDFKLARKQQISD